MADQQALWKEVTPAELKVGYMEMVGMVAQRREFRVIEQLENGNYKVHNPARISDAEREAMVEAFPPAPVDRRRGDRRGR